MSKKTTSLHEFTDKVKAWYEAGHIKAPIHLSGGSEKQCREIFKQYHKKGDWVCSTHRSHYHWLLSGHSENELLGQILLGHSMHIFGERFLTSAIVGGIAPIAVGIALALQKKKSRNKVLCFIGDAASRCGVVLESMRYARGHNLPIIFITEDNGKCVNADTTTTWGLGHTNNDVEYFYDRKFPHAGTGKYVMF